MRSLNNFVNEHGLAKTTVRRWLNEQGYSTADGLSAEAENVAYQEFVIDRKMPCVTVVDEPSHGVSLDGYGDELTFNAAAIVGLTNGTQGAIAALRQVSGVAAALRQGVERVEARAKADYHEVSAVARDVAAELDALQHTITRVQAESAVLEAMKLDRLNDGLASKAKIDELRGGK